MCAVQLCETHNVYRCCMGEYIHLCTFVRRLHACIFLVLFYTVRLSNCLLNCTRTHTLARVLVLEVLDNSRLRVESSGLGGVLGVFEHSGDLNLVAFRAFDWFKSSLKRQIAQDGKQNTFLCSETSCTYDTSFRHNDARARRVREGRGGRSVSKLPCSDFLG